MPKVNGIDITDVTRPFSLQEWNVLPIPCQNYIHSERKKLCGGNGGHKIGSSNNNGKNKESQQEQQEADENAGDTFGRASYNNGKSQK